MSWVGERFKSALVIVLCVALISILLVLRMLLSGPEEPVEDGQAVVSSLAVYSEGTR